MVRSLVQRALLVAAGLLVGLGTLEGALRVAALVLPQRLERAGAPAPRAPGEIRILCGGDSHTFGVGVARADAYPAQLEEILRAHGVRATVVNAGIPGQNSSQLRESLPPRIAEDRPDVVVVWVGANNQWKATTAPNAPPRPRLRDRFLVLRFLKLLLVKHEGVSGDFRAELAETLTRQPTLPPPQTPPDRERRSAEATAALTLADLVPLLDTVRQADAKSVLLTYPVTLGTLLAQIDDAIVAAAGGTPATLVDLRYVALRHRARITKLLLPDMHPNARFYRAIAWEIARTLIRTRVLPTPSRS